MTWSFNGYRQFEKCHRQWYYRNIVASALSKDPYRREMFILSKLKSLDAWRGDLVDYMISVVISRKISQEKELSLDNLLWIANQVFETQLDYAKNRKYRSPNVELSGDAEFAALQEFDKGKGIPKAELDRARQDVQTAITNFIGHEEIIERLRDAQKIVTQRTLTHAFSKFKITGRPDLIAFYEDEPPHIYDWKVHTFATRAYDDQLMCYAYSLNEVKPHKDFPHEYKNFNILDYRLTEFQLLLNEERNYEVTQEELDHTIDTMASGLMHMSRLGAGQKFEQATPADFPATGDTSQCNSCPFTLKCKQHDDEI